MKHTAEAVNVNDCVIYCREMTTPNGTYHFARSKNRRPPTLIKITRTRYKTLVRYHDGDQFQIGYHVTIWKRGWHHIKGARKTAKQRAKK